MIKIPFNFVALTMRNGKTRPNTAKHNQRWIPTMTNAAIRSDWMKSSLLRVAPAPPGDMGDSINYVCIKTISSVWTIMQCVVHILGPPQKKRMKTMIKAAAMYGTHWLESCMTTISFTYLCILLCRQFWELLSNSCLCTQQQMTADTCFAVMWTGLCQYCWQYIFIWSLGPISFMMTPYFLSYPWWCQAMWIVLSFLSNPIQWWSIYHIHMAFIFLQCCTQGGTFDCWNNFTLLCSRLPDIKT